MTDRPTLLLILRQAWREIWRPGTSMILVMSGSALVIGPLIALAICLQLVNSGNEFFEPWIPPLLRIATITVWVGLPQTLFGVGLGIREALRAKQVTPSAKD